MLTASDQIVITVAQWIRLQIRLSALEQSGERLAYRFEFPDETTVVCHICFTDEDSNPLGAIPERERMEIYENWIFLAKGVMSRALEAAELPSTIRWSAHVRFVLDVTRGMGTSLVHKSEVQFSWPDDAS